MATGILARISLIASYFRCQSYFASFQGIWNYLDHCCHGYYEKCVIFLDSDEIIQQLMYINSSFHGNELI